MGKNIYRILFKYVGEKMFFKRRRYLLLFFLFIILPLALSSTLKVWEQKTKKELEKGEVISVSITEEGNIILPPTLKELYTTPEPYLWCLAIDLKGNVYTGGGTEGKVFQIDFNGQGRLFFDSDEIQVNAIAVDSAANIIVATMPNGSIYKLSAAGQVNKLYTPKARYIWSLAVDKSGNIYAGSGTDGIVYKIDQQGNGEELFNSEETHIKSLAIDKEGNILAGSAPHSQIFRISPDGKVYVLYDAPLNEINCLEIGQDGNIYAAAIAKDADKKDITERKDEKTSEKEVSSFSIASSLKAEKKEKSIIYKISTDYSVEKIWSSSSYIVHSLELDREGNLIIGTGDKGMIYSLTPKGEETLLLKCDEKQITAMVSDRRNSIYVATSNLGKVFKLSFVHPNQGIYHSQVKDTNTISQWGMLSWNATLKEGTEIRLYTRTGNTAKPDNTWSPWSPAYRQPKGSMISSPPARFIQWKAELISKDISYTPILHDVAIAYLQKNIKPRITEIKIHPPGIYFKRPLALDEEKELNMPEDFQSFEDEREGDKGARPESLGKKAYRKGVRFISWKADDANGDRLCFALYYKASDEHKWKKLKTEINESSFFWDTTAVPDGIYRTKLEASDSPSNPASLALIETRISEAFNIDNTSPRISNILADKTAQGIRITFIAEDSFSFIRRASYSVDASSWKNIYSKDGILDSYKEEFEIILKNLTSGEHTIVLRVEDSLYNIATDKAKVQ